MAPKYKGSDAGNSDVPEKSCKVPPLSEKVEVLNWIWRETKSDAKINGKNKSFICEIRKERKTFMLVLLPHLKMQKLRPGAI